MKIKNSNLIICLFDRLALPLWFITVILFFVLLKYGAMFLGLTGAVMVTANILWATIRNVNELEIPLAPGKRLVFAFGSTFYTNLITGRTFIIRTWANKI